MAVLRLVDDGVGLSVGIFLVAFVFTNLTRILVHALFVVFIIMAGKKGSIVSFAKWFEFAVLREF